MLNIDLILASTAGHWYHIPAHYRVNNSSLAVPKNINFLQKLLACSNETCFTIILSSGISLLHLPSNIQWLKVLTQLRHEIKETSKFTVQKIVAWYIE